MVKIATLTRLKGIGENDATLLIHPRVREDRIARLLDDPDKLQEMRKQREAETRRRQAEERLRKSRYHSRGMSM